MVIFLSKKKELEKICSLQFLHKKWHWNLPQSSLFSIEHWCKQFIILCLIHERKLLTVNGTLFINVAQSYFQHGLGSN